MTHRHVYKPVGQSHQHPSIVRCDCGHTLHDALPSPGWKLMHELALLSMDPDSTLDRDSDVDIWGFEGNSPERESRRKRAHASDLEHVGLAGPLSLSCPRGRTKP